MQPRAPALRSCSRAALLAGCHAVSGRLGSVGDAKASNDAIERVKAKLRGSFAASEIREQVTAKLRNDFASLRLRSTAYHILQPPTPEGLKAASAIKVQIESEVAKGAYVLDVFQRLALELSTDPESAQQGGLLDADFCPGTFRKGAEKLEELCFTEDIGKPLGPFSTPFGYSVLLITKRTGCSLDNPQLTQLEKFPDGRGRLVATEASQRMNVPEVLSTLFVVVTVFQLAASALVPLWVPVVAPLLNLE
eukprot:CAMPEP_0117550996 /NCGR_PEP_ID=MMETSP0784-20121206/48964_1 /TAXON_ID=39447 /ORGANISM="" /LENGTH=249 /DNA_ID=CAMNT_0005348023 /DNA_START=137 /DNA_END=886 /DNA_ORIENTATION=-